MLTLSGTNLFKQIDDLIDENFSKYVTWRRQIHENPELSWEEVETTRFIRQRLAEMHLETQTGARDLGCITEFDFGAPTQRRIAIRADIDAIPVCEANEVEFRSRHPEVMHACGHDVHATILLAVCETLMRLKQRVELDIPVAVRAIFQPAEEVAQGAAEMIERGVLDNVDEILALHVDPHRRVGRVGLREGVQTAYCDEIKVRITAEGGHGARPHETTDPILTAAQFVNAVYAQIPRCFDNRTAGVLTFCSVQSGHSANVIPTHCDLHGTLRTLDEGQRTQIKSHLERLAGAIGSAFGAHIEVHYGVSSPSVSNHPNAIDLFRRAAEAGPEPMGVDEIPISMGSEDFAWYLHQVPGALARVGSATHASQSHPLHSPYFDVDERVIREGCRLMTRSVLLWGRPKLLQN